MSRNARIQFILLALLGWLVAARAQEVFPQPATNSAARVVIVQGTNLLHAYLPDEVRVTAAFNLGLTTFTHATNVSTAWLSLVSTNDTVGIKVFSEPGPLCGTRPAIVAAIVRGLLAAGLPPGRIVIWDKHADDLRAAGFFQLGAQLGVRVAGAMDTGYDPTNFYLPDSPIIGDLVWGDLEFGKKGKGVGKRSFVTKLLSHDITKIICVAPLVNEPEAGVCGQFYSLSLGSVDNTRRFDDDPDRLAVALPEIYALPSVGDRVVLNVTDALLGQNDGGPAGYLQFSTVLDQIWFSHDPVALDTLALKELERERRKFNPDAPPFHSNFTIYTNASLLQLGISDPARIQVREVRK